ATDDAAITAVELIPHITANDKPYDGGTSATLSAQWVTGMVNNETDVTLIVGDKSFNNANIGTRTVTASSLTLGGAKAGNYVLAVSATATDDAAIMALPITITANPQSKYCGQNDPEFTYEISSGTLVLGDVFTGSLSREFGESAGPSYPILQGSLTLGNNYDITYIGDNLSVLGVLLDASGSSFTVQTGGTTATLKAFVTASPNGNSANNVNVSFKVFDGINQTVASGSAISGVNGVNGEASLDINISSLPIGLYRVEAVAGLACSSSTGYMTIYDPNGSFITGGGWITSPAGAYVADQSLTGKANFGFVSKYKKGSNLVEGNTEFQFNAGNFNFKSNSLDTGTLVISGAKATYRGVGTVNGSGNYGFMVSAIDGQITGGGGIDKFRIKIWNIATGNTVVYDNQIGSADNVDAITALGGGSIVIHEVKKKTTKVSTLAEKTVEPILFNIKAYPNPSNQYFTLELEGASNEKVEVVVYDVLGRLVKHIEKNDAEPISFGEDFPNGVYIAITSQGVNRKTQRLIKQ
ncbi:MBG domain-containing protein, partial [Flavobacterium maritimum]|uniref:MBG domain-containing protein n=1 Tax=Flavobacterium maritimum TaxID=3149042 RepID=UPI0032B31B90